LALDLASLFGRKNPPLFGLDISTSDIKLVELSQNSEKEFKLERYASEVLPKGAVVDGNVENIDQVVEAIRRVIKKAEQVQRMLRWLCQLLLSLLKKLYCQAP